MAGNDKENARRITRVQAKTYRAGVQILPKVSRGRGGGSEEVLSGQVEGSQPDRGQQYVEYSGSQS